MIGAKGAEFSGDVSFREQLAMDIDFIPLGRKSDASGETEVQMRPKKAMAVKRGNTIKARDKPFVESSSV